MAFQTINKEYYFSSSLGVFEYIYKITFMDKNTFKITYVYLYESEYFEDPFLFTTDEAFFPQMYDENKNRSDEFMNFIKSHKLVHWSRKEVESELDKDSLLYSLFMEAINYEDEVNTNCRPLYMKQNSL